VHLVAGRLLGRGHLAPLSVVRPGAIAACSSRGTRARLRELGASLALSARGVGKPRARRRSTRAPRQTKSTALRALAELGVDAVTQRGRLIRVAAQRGAENESGVMNLALAMLRF